MTHPLRDAYLLLLRLCVLDRDSHCVADRLDHSELLIPVQVSTHLDNLLSSIGLQSLLRRGVDEGNIARCRSGGAHLVVSLSCYLGE